jgi:hypothetical protein
MNRGKARGVAPRPPPVQAWTPPEGAALWTPAKGSGPWNPLVGCGGSRQWTRLSPLWVESRPFQFHGTDVRRGYEAENCAPGRPISQLCMGDYENPPMQPESDAYGVLAFAIGGGFQVPSRIEGGVSFGQ